MDDSLKGRLRLDRFVKSIRSTNIRDENEVQPIARISGEDVSDLICLGLITNRRNY